VTQLFVEKFSLIAELAEAKSWLQIQADLGLTENTIAAYGRALEDYLGFCKRSGLTPKEVTRAQIVAYIHDLRTRPGKKGAKVKRIDSGAGLSNATMQHWNGNGSRVNSTPTESSPRQNPSRRLSLRTHASSLMTFGRNFCGLA
jgi:hypothetical protein